MSRIVDLHHHVIPDFYWEASNEDGNAGGWGQPQPGPSAPFADLTVAVEVAGPAIGTPGVNFGDDVAARASRARSTIPRGRQTDRPDRSRVRRWRCRTRKGRSGRSPHGFDVLELDGVSVMTKRVAATRATGVSTRSSRLQRRAGPSPSTATRPIAHAGPARLAARLPLDTSRQSRSSTTAARSPVPRASSVFRHAGRTSRSPPPRLPDLLEMDVIPGAQERGAFADALPRLYWDTASAFSDPVLHMLRSVTGLQNVVFGTDYPYPRDAISIAGLRQLQHTTELDESERRGLLGGSAARLIPRLAGLSDPAPPLEHAHAPRAS